MVEDEGAVLDLLMEALAEAGYQVLHARDGHQGLAVAQALPRLDLLVTDVGLPGLNGRQLADMCREARPDLKVLFITGYAEGAASPSGFLAPGMAIVTKPFVLHAVVARAREMLDSE